MAKKSIKYKLPYYSICGKSERKRFEHYFYAEHDVDAIRKARRYIARKNAIEKKRKSGIIYYAPWVVFVVETRRPIFYF